MHFTPDTLQDCNRIFRLNLINSISGIKQANLIGTCDKEGRSNLAIFNSIVHIGSNPALLGFILRPESEVRRHTWENIQSTGLYTVNMVGSAFVTQAHYTSAKFPKKTSEFAACGLTETYQFGFGAPFVAESPVQIGLQFREAVPIRLNDTQLVIGEIEHLVVPDNWVLEDGQVALETEAVGVSGLNRYCSLNPLADFPFARPEEVPDFGKERP
jgi:flavin reductase (DIM6/NTAB) family NADH-FMN oxidoreductase RutF